MKWENLKPIVVLTVICLVVSAALAGTYNLTKPVIDAAKAAQANEALAAVLPEGADFEEVTVTAENVTKAYKAGKRYILVVVAEGAGSGQEIGKYIAEHTNIDTRVSVLGHIQRGGSPTVIDRVKASQLGEQAALAIISGLSDIVFGFNKGHVVSINLHDAVNNKKTLDPEYAHLARVLF